MKYIQYINLKLKHRIKLRLRARKIVTTNGKCSLTYLINGIYCEVWNVPCKKVKEVKA